MEGTAGGGRFVWARRASFHIDRADRWRWGPGGEVAADGDAVWISAHDVDAVYRVPLP